MSTSDAEGTTAGVLRLDAAFGWRHAPDATESAVKPAHSPAKSGETAETLPAQTSCYLCRDDDAHVPLLHVRIRGSDQWVCVHCLPRLIHG